MHWLIWALPIYGIRALYSCCTSYEAQCGKKVLMPHANSEGPDERVHPCRLIWTFFVCIYYSIHWFCKRAMQALISLRKCAGWSGPALSADSIRDLFVCCASYANSSAQVTLQTHTTYPGALLYWMFSILWASSAIDKLMIHYKTVLDIRQFESGPQKCCIQTKMYRLFLKKNDHLYIFIWIQHG